MKRPHRTHLIAMTVAMTPMAFVLVRSMSKLYGTWGVALGLLTWFAALVPGMAVIWLRARKRTQTA